MYIKRTLEPFLTNITENFPVLLITGPRQVGKTTILRHLAKDKLTYVTLDKPEVALSARTEPELFLQRFTPPVLIDEIQYAPQLLPYIKMYVDEHRKPGAFWLTGSQQFQLMKGVSESLAGRVGIINLLGLSLQEQSNNAYLGPFLPTKNLLNQRLSHIQTLSLKDVYNIIWYGSFPALWTNRENNGQPVNDNIIKPNNVDRDVFYNSYIQTYLQRDLHDLGNIGDVDLFFQFLRATAARTGQLLNISDIARDTGISPKTATNWLAILKASYIIYLLEPFHNNLTSRMVKAPKLYFLDTGLCSYLTEWSSPESLEAGAMSGHILETFIFTEILKSYWHNGKRAPIYYYRDKDKKEIDLLIVQDDIIYPLEFKKTASPGKDDVRHFNLLANTGKKIGEGGVICLAKTLLPITSQTNIIPVGML